MIFIEYSITALTKMSGVSTRTLRYYDEIGLLKPLRVASSGYRIYGQAEVDLLQQILFFKELDFPLEEIKNILYSPNFDKLEAFQNHLDTLQKKQSQLNLLINNVKRSLSAMEGEIKMSDKEKFEGFKQKLINDNEEKYGKEIREKYGDEAVNASNAQLAGLTAEQYEKSIKLQTEFEETLKTAFAEGNPESDTAQKACELHKQWLCIFYPKYNREYHLGLAEMYVADKRFRANYDKLGKGCTEFLRDAINFFVTKSA